MFETMKLRQRILLGYLAPLLLLIGVITLVFIILEHASEHNELVDVAYVIEDNARELASDLEVIQSASRGYLLQRNPTSRETLLQARKDFSDHYEKLDKEIKDTVQRDNLRQLFELAQTLDAAQQHQMGMVDDGKVQEGIAYWAKESLPKAHETRVLMDKFTARETELLKQNKEAYQAAMRMVGYSIIYGMLGAIALAIAIALWLAAVVSRKITANATQLSAAANEIAATITQHERTASQQAAAANETSATIVELSTSSRKSAEQAAAAAAVAEQSGTAATQGDETTQQAVEAMGSLKEKIGATAEQILHLGEQTAQIGSIATVLKDLAGQINMLALNAAVEAARAGEHGKGFAVVASEIRKLADESKKSAEQTALLVADVQKATNSSIMMTEEGRYTVTDVTKLVRKVAELFGNLAGLAGSANENAQQVMLNIQQQSAAFNQVVEATNSIAAGAKDTAAGISQTKIGVQNLNEAANNLKAIA
ncbi:MAG: methyl-accepting chemotaxis protein [Candidatus Thiodiazotropha sp.]